MCHIRQHMHHHYLYIVANFLCLLQRYVPLLVAASSEFAQHWNLSPNKPAPTGSFATHVPRLIPPHLMQHNWKWYLFCPSLHYPHMRCLRCPVAPTRKIFIFCLFIIVCRVFVRVICSCLTFVMMSRKLNP